MERVLFSVIILLFPHFMDAQNTASVSGYISNTVTGEPLISANFSIKESPKGTSANTSGYFALANLPPGSYTVVATFIGYKRFEKEISLEAGENLYLNIELEPEELEMEEIVVESQKSKREEQSLGTAEISSKRIKKMPSVFQADVFRSLQLLPGVKAASDFSSGLYIRGGSPDQTLILLDRTTVYNPSHFLGFFSTFNPDAVEDVKLYKGGYPARYGGRLGSVLSISSKEGNRKEFRGSATVGLLASSLTVEGPFKGGSYMFAIRRSTLEPLLALLQQYSDNIPESFYFLDMNGKLSIDANENNNFSVAFYNGVDDLRFPFADDAGVGLNYGNQVLSATWTHFFSEQLFSDFTLTRARYFNFPSFNIASTPYERSNNIHDFSFKADLEYLPTQNHKISAGVRAGSFLLKLHDEFDGQKTFGTRTHSQYGSVYLQDQWAISQKWTATTGLRAATFSEGNYLRLEPRLSIEYKPTGRFQIQAAYGRYNQYLTLVSSEAFSGFDVWLTTKEGVPPAYGNQYIAGFKTIPWENYRLDVEFYYRSMKSLFEPDPFVPNQSGLSYPQIFRFGQGYAYGAELFFERQVGRLTGFIGYTFSVTRRKFPTFNQSIPDNPIGFYPPKYDRLHDLKAVLGYEFSDHWSSSIVFNYATGQAFTEPMGRSAAFDFPTTMNRMDQLLVNSLNGSRLPPYHRLDISISRSGTFFGIGEATWKMQFINAYSRRNIWFYRYNWDENPVEREAVQLLPVLPSISYSLDF